MSPLGSNLRFAGHVYDSTVVSADARVHLGDTFHHRSPAQTRTAHGGGISAGPRFSYTTASVNAENFVCRHCGKSQGQPEVFRDPSGFNHATLLPGLPNTFSSKARIDNSGYTKPLSPNSDAIVKWFDAPARFAPESFQREADTNRWFLGGSAFRIWKSTPPSFLHIHGPVGCGKTVLSYAVVTELNQKFQDLGAHILYFCFSALDEQRQTLRSFVKSLMVQLCPPDFLPYDLRQLYDKHHKRYPATESSNDELETVFRSMVKAITSDCFIVVDGIDEVSFGPRRTEVLSFLHSLTEWQLPRLRLLLTSRPQDDILNWIHRHPSLRSMEVPKEAIARDMRTFVRNSIDRDPSLKNLLPETKSSIIKTLCGDDNYMFQWASLQLDRMRFLRIVSDSTVKTLLSQLPPDLNNTYARIISEVQPQFADEARAALTWLSFSSRSIFIEELQEICSYPSGDFTESNHWPVRDVMALLPSVVRLDPWPDFQDWEALPARTHVVLLAHFSIREYLTSHAIHSGPSPNFALNSALAHESIALTCVTYILTSNKPESSARQPVLLEYAWSYWAMHAISETSSGPCDNVESRMIHVFAQVSYWGKLGWIPKKIRSGLGRFELPELKDRLMVPYFLPEIQRYNHRDGPLSAPEFWAMVRSSKVSNNPSENQINLIKMRASPHRFTEIQCTSHVTLLPGTEPFIAISWAWSNTSKAPVFDHVIRIGGIPLMCPHSLVQNLRNIRQLEGENPRPIWIDALSIDQSNLEARASSLGLLAKIFGNAAAVIVMLGDADSGDEILIDILHELHRLLSMPTPQEQDFLDLKRMWQAYHPSHHEGLTKIFSRCWWKRMWVLQEYLLPRRITFMLGSLSFTSDIIETLVKHQSNLEDLISRLEADKRPAEDDVATDQQSLKRWTHSNIWRSICEITRTRLSVQDGKQFGLARLLYLARKRECEDERDRVFSLKGMASDAEAMPLDYRLSQVGLRIAVTKALIELHGCLDHLSWIQHFEHGQPTWVLPDFLFEAPERTPLVKGYFVHDTPGFEQFDAARGSRLTDLTRDKQSDHLTVSGILVSMVKSMLDLDDMPQDFRHRLGIDDADFHRISHGRELARLQSGRIGLVPPDTRLRDKVVILKGGKVPYVLRPLLMSPDTHRLVGECFIAGIMNGEYVEQCKDQGMEFAEYKLV